MVPNSNVEQRQARVRERVEAQERARARTREAREYTRSTTRPPFEDVRTAIDTATAVATLAARDGGGMDAEGVRAILGSLLTARALMDRADVMTAPEGREGPREGRIATMGGGPAPEDCTHENAVAIPTMSGGGGWVCECGASS